MEYHQSTTTVAEGIKAVFGVARTVISASDSIPDALEASQDSDVVVLVVGDWIDEIGEMHDRADLQLRPSQRWLLRALADAPIRLITVVIASKPLLIGEVLAASNAVVYAFNPGMQGGVAVANILAGVANPSGRLPITFPRHVGQLPVFYYGERGGHSSRYCDLQEGPLLPFGFGLSYTKFLYQDLTLSVVSASAGDIVSVSVLIANQGDRPGAETAQLYIQDLVSSVTTPRKMLKGFRKVLIEAHSTELVVFDLPIDELSIVDSVGNRCVEPGQFRVMVGSSSRDEDLLIADLFVE
jgi:beta-glucosidase